MAVTPKLNNILLQFFGQFEPHTLPLSVTFQHRPKKNICVYTYATYQTHSLHFSLNKSMERAGKLSRFFCSTSPYVLGLEWRTFWSARTHKK
jgi:hypothetical protein